MTTKQVIAFLRRRRQLELKATRNAQKMHNWDAVNMHIENDLDLRGVIRLLRATERGAGK
jgi:hypothetical protein